MLRKTARWAMMSLWAGAAMAPASAATVEIVIDKMAFQPSEVSVKVGDTVRWMNNDILAHTATVNSSFNLVIASKKAGEIVAGNAGTFEYFCKFHPNMKGRIIVAP